MADQLTDTKDTFLQMAREYPVRTALFSFGLPVFALLQLINGVVHESSLLLLGAFSVLVVVYSVKLTQYQIAAYRRNTLARQWIQGD